MRLIVSAYRHNDYVPQEKIRSVKLGEVSREIPDTLPYYVVGEEVVRALGDFKRKGHPIQDLEFLLRFEP